MTLLRGQDVETKNAAQYRAACPRSTLVGQSNQPKTSETEFAPDGRRGLLSFLRRSRIRFLFLRLCRGHRLSVRRNVVVVPRAGRALVVMLALSLLALCAIELVCEQDPCGVDASGASLED